MNGLSWMLYLASIVQNLQVVLVLVALFGVMGIGAVAFFQSMEEGSTRAHRWLWVPVLCALVVCVIPSKDTMYLIAGSQIGETVVQSPDAQEIYGLVKDKLRDLLKTQPNKG